GIRLSRLGSEGRIAIVTDVDAGCGGRGSVGRPWQSQGGRTARERSGGARTTTLNRCRESFGGLVPGSPAGFCDGGRRRRSRVVLAPVAGVKFAGGGAARPGAATPSIRGRRWQKGTRRRGDHV